MNKYRNVISRGYSFEQIYLPPDEYAMVMSELNTHMSDKDRNRKFVTKAIGNYFYTFLNKAFDEYIIVDKYPIEPSNEDIWEDL